MRRCPTCKQTIPDPPLKQESAEVKLLLDLRWLRDAETPLWWIPLENREEDVMSLIAQGFAEPQEYTQIIGRGKSQTTKQKIGLVITKKGLETLERNYSTLIKAGYK